MESEVDTLVTAWRTAAQELGIRVDAPFELTDHNLRVHRFTAHLPDFGGPKGMVVLSSQPPTHDSDSDTLEFARSKGLWHSILNAEQYSDFDRDEFVATLDDWQYFGPPERRPSWYKGTVWGHEEREQGTGGDSASQNTTV